MNTLFDNEIRLNMLKLLQEEPELTQREMNQKMGVSLGKINYCISALTKKGMIKVERFKKSENKSAYMYRLTPKGFEELASLTVSFLKIRIAEYDQIKIEIKQLSDQINKINPELGNDPELMKNLKNIY
ncbi:MAG: MarR family EPS-associated transcriptional regulator [Proteobacteria bacterium]|nr:MarR family EPS-associated transcriptional regulator [Pseudomonadota bacterium]MBU1389457.1 MarR family EPS-associated transcriptional regulator [Pseudomonadota bacterium]MBU1541277.1 MarR family EPS-associated transcriptional regulator [Pseudomonadota bacterium]MBU2429323.1 MarR family EPS-associated transcriptional regulator [Pseudomonadota bacterium]